MIEWYSIVYMYHIFFTPSSVDGHLGCIHVLAIVHSAAVNIGACVSFQISFCFEVPPPLDIYMRVKFLGHRIALFLVFEKSPYCSPQWLHQFTLHQQCRRVLFFTHTCQHLFFLMVAILTDVR